MLKKTNKPELEKEGDDAAEVDFEALIREHKKTEWGKQPTTFLKKLLMTPEQLDAYRRDRILQLERVFEKYGIDPDGEHVWRDLAFALLRRYEPGFSSRSGRPKERPDDFTLIFMIELLRCRDGLTIPEACEAIAENGVIKGKPTTKTLQNRYKKLKRDRHWKAIIQGFEEIKAKVGEDRYIEALRKWLGARIN